MNDTPVAILFDSTRYPLWGSLCGAHPSSKSRTAHDVYYNRREGGQDRLKALDLRYSDGGMATPVVILSNNIVGKSSNLGSN